VVVIPRTVSFVVPIRTVVPITCG